MVNIDIGCGYLSHLHYPKFFYDVGLDMNLDKADKDFIEMWKNNNLIIGDAENLPFRNEVFDEESLRAILEHLMNPIYAIFEIKRTLREKGEALITIPIIVSHQKDYLQKLITQFPFSIWDVFKCMKRMFPNLKTKGFYHQSDIKPEHIIKYFRCFDIKKTRYRHKWFYGIWGKIIKKYITNGKEPLKDQQGFYDILVMK